VNDDGTGWSLFWGILAGMIALCCVVFALFYKGLAKPGLDRQ
jgi:hypothetical protein